MRPFPRTSSTCPAVGVARTEGPSAAAARTPARRAAAPSSRRRRPRYSSWRRKTAHAARTGTTTSRVVPTSGDRTSTMGCPSAAAVAGPTSPCGVQAARTGNAPSNREHDVGDEPDPAGERRRPAERARQERDRRERDLPEPQEQAHHRPPDGRGTFEQPRGVGDTRRSARRAMPHRGSPPARSAWRRRTRPVRRAWSG